MQPRNLFLSSLSAEQKIVLENKFRRSIDELDSIVSEHKKLYNYFLLHYGIANYGSCLLFLTFPITTSNEGIQSFVSAISPNTNVSNQIGYGIGIPLSVINVVYFTCLFSVRQAAAEATIGFVLRESLLTRTKKMLSDAKKEPLKAIKESVIHIVKENVVATCNATGAITELLYMPMQFNTWYEWLPVPFVLYYGNEYYESYLRADFEKGIEFWHNSKEKNPWLMKEMVYEGNIALPLQTWLQGASSVGLRAYPFFYYIAIAAREKLGFWINPNFVLACTVLHSICVLYPATYKKYVHDYQQIVSTLSTNPQIIECAHTILSRSHLENTDVNQQKVIKNLIWSEMKIFREIQINTLGRMQLFKEEPMTAILIGFRSLVMGTILGYGLANRINFMDQNLSYALLIPLLAGAFGIHLVRAEEQRFYYKKQNQILNPQPNIQNEEIPKSVLAVSSSLNIIGALVSAMMTIGTLSLLINKNEPDITVVIILLCVERMLNAIDFNRHKLDKTLSDMKKSLPSLSGLFACRKHHEPVAREPDVSVIPLPTLI